MASSTNIAAASATLVTGIAVVLFFEWHTDEPLVVLPVLLVTCLAAGLAAPRSWLASGTLIGWAILAAHAVSNATGLWIPRYQQRPPSAGDWIAMSLLVLPAVGCAYAGSRLRSQPRRTAA